MSVNNPWLTPYQRSYNSIKSQLITQLKKDIPQLTDLSEGNIFILIISAFAAMAEVLHYYIDSMGREAFFPTARRYSSLMKHAKLVDYHIKSAVAPTVDVVLYRKSGEKFGIALEIPENTQFTSTDGKTWYSTRKIVTSPDTYSVRIPLIQKELAGENIDLGTITSQNIEIYLPEPPSNKKYVEGSMVLKMTNGQITDTWTLVDTFAYSSSEDKVYKVELDSQMNPRIVFGEGLFGLKPTVGDKVTASFYYTYGADANIDAGSFNTVPSVLNNKGINDLAINQPNPASGGSDYENFSMLKNHVPLSIKTLGVAVTREDFESLAMLQPGVNKAYVYYKCGKQVNIYISPDGGIEAGASLIQKVEQVLTKAKVITTNINVYSTHASHIYLDATITGKKSFNKSDIYNQVEKALLETYNKENSGVNQVIHLSDIYALIDNCSMVDYLKLNKLYMVSYPIPQRKDIEEEETIPLIIDKLSLNSLSGDTYKEVKIVIAEDASGYTITVGEETSEKISWGQLYNWNKSDLNFDIVISQDNISYNASDSYTFQISPMNRDLEPYNYQIPIFESSNIILDIYESI